VQRHSPYHVVFVPPELRLGSTRPFRSAQEDYLKRFMTRATSFTLSCRFCHARRRRAAFRQKRRQKTLKKSPKVKVK